MTERKTIDMSNLRKVNDETREALFDVLYTAISYEQSIAGHAGFSDQINSIIDAMQDAGFVITNQKVEA